MDNSAAGNVVLIPMLPVMLNDATDFSAVKFVGTSPVREFMISSSRL